MTVLEVGEAARILGVSPRQVQHLVAAGSISALARGVVDAQSVELLVARRGVSHRRPWAPETAVPWRNTVADRPTIDVPTPPGGWGMPWPNVAELAAVFPHENWTLVGGLMTQLHAIAAGIDTLRPTDDVDMVLHIETTRGLVAKAAEALEALGYEFAPSIDDRNPIAHHSTANISRWPTNARRGRFTSC